MKKEVSLDKAVRLINHGPVVMVSSLYDGKANITPVAWTMPAEKNPPKIVLEIGENHFIFDCILKTGDFVVNIPGKDMAEKIVQCGSCSGRDVNKFEEYGLTISPAKKVASPVLAEAVASLECTLVRDEHLLKEYNIVVGKVEYAEAEEEAFSEHWLFGKDEYKTIHHLGNRTFCFPEGEIIDLRKG